MMMTPITTLFATSHNYSRTIEHCNALYKKIEPLVYPCFAGGTAVFHCGYGSVELLQSHATCQTRRTSSTCQEVLAPSREFLDLHGTLITATGISSALEALNATGVLNYGELSRLVCGAGSAFFLYANLFALEENIRVYQALKAQEMENTVHDQKAHDWQKLSAVWGIMSNIGYIIATGALLFNAPTAIALAIGVIAAFSGGLKIVSDFMLWHTKEQTPEATKSPF